MPDPPVDPNDNVPNDRLPVVRDGSVVSPQAWSVLRGVLDQHLTGEERCGVEDPAVLLPPLACATDLMALAWEVLGGSPTAASKLRRALGSFSPGPTPTFAAERVRQLAMGVERCGPTTPPGRQPTDHPLFPLSRLMPVAVAAAYSARDVPELVGLLGALELGLSGMGELADLYDAGVRGGPELELDALRGAYTTAVRRVQSRPWPDGGGVALPGFAPPVGLPGTPGWPFPLPWPGGPGATPLPVPTPFGPGTPGGGLPGPPVFDDFELCVDEAIANMHRRGLGLDHLFGTGGPRYEIASVSPDNVCPGARIAIRGNGFTGAESVRFTAAGSRVVSVTPVTVSDTRVVAVVPEGAVSGPVWLYIPVELEVCRGRHITVAMRGTAGDFVSGTVRITRFHVDPAVGCIPVGRATNLHWAVEPDDADVEIQQSEGATTMTLFTGTGPSGSIALDSSTVGRRGYVIEATNPRGTCGTDVRTATLDIDGPPPVLTIPAVEVTQGIQRFILDIPSAGTNNSIALVAGKDTIVRVFVHSDRGGFDGDRARVTGVLSIPGRHFYRPINGAPAGSAPIIEVDSSQSRIVTDGSLNFLIPAAEAHGAGISMRIEVFTVDRCPDPVSVVHTRTATWLERPVLPVTVRRISEPGTGDVVSEVDALRIVTQAFDRLPSPPTEVRVRPGVFTIHEGTTESNYCRDRGFYQLALSVAYEHNRVEGLAPHPHETVWIGLFFRSDCTSGGMMSWPWTSTCISQPDSEVAAHEIAHCVGMGHTVTSAGERCEDIAQPIACHRLPADGTVLEAVFDIRNNLIRFPTWDLMSYQPGYRFPHPDHWERIRALMDTRF